MSFFPLSDEEPPTDPPWTDPNSVQDEGVSAEGRNMTDEDDYVVPDSEPLHEYPTGDPLDELTVSLSVSPHETLVSLADRV
jgi:hypothetical protein